MKKPIFLIFVIAVIGCGKSSDSKQAETKSFDNTDLHEQPDLTIQNQRLRYENDYYELSVYPHVDTLTNRYTAKVLLKGVKDTVFLKQVNSDSLRLAILKSNHNSDSVDLNHLAEYELRTIVPTAGIRGYNSYLVARLSAKNRPDLYVKFAIKAWGDNRSKKERLWVLWYNHNEDHFNRQLSQQNLQTDKS